MFTIPELAMPRTRKVTTIYNGKKEICVYIQLIHGLEECSDEDE